MGGRRFDMHAEDLRDGRARICPLPAPVRYRATCATWALALQVGPVVIDEATVRQFLQAGSNDRIQEVGVFPAPQVDLAGPVALGTLPEGEELALSDDWLSVAELETHFSDEPKIAAVLPGGRVRRLDVDPRILTFEDVAEPRVAKGPVRQIDQRTWILDSRKEPAVLSFGNDDREVVIWGDSGLVWVFLLRKGG